MWVTLVVLLLGIGAWAFTTRPRPDPYGDGTVHQVAADCTVENGCWIAIGPPEHEGWHGQTAIQIPDPWRNRQVVGTLTINSN